MTYRPCESLLRDKMKNLSDLERFYLMRELETGRAWGVWPAPRG